MSTTLGLALAASASLLALYAALAARAVLHKTGRALWLFDLLGDVAVLLAFAAGAAAAGAVVAFAVSLV